MRAPPFPCLSRGLPAAIALGFALVGGTASAQAGSGGVAAPASSPSRSTSMANPEAGGAFTLVQLKDAVAARIGPWKQTRIDVPLQRRAVPENKVVYTYAQGRQTATLTIVDRGAINSAPGPAHWAGPPNRRETTDGAEFVYRDGGHTVREIERRQAPAREVVLLLANGIQLSAAGEADMPALKALAQGPMAAAAALVRTAK